MDSLLNPFKSTLHQAGEATVAAQKHLLELQRAQMKLVEEQTVSAFKMNKAGFEASTEFMNNVNKTMLAAFAPKAPAATPAA